MKVFLDDVREAPEGWVRAYWPDEVISYLKTGRVSELSLDHDLGNDLKGTGYTVLVWIEYQTVVNGFDPPKITVHSANPPAGIRMEAAIRILQ